MGAERRGGFDALREHEAARRAETAAIEPDVKLTTRDIVHSVWWGFGAAASGGAPWPSSLTCLVLAQRLLNLEKRHLRLKNEKNSARQAAEQPACENCVLTSDSFPVAKQMPNKGWFSVTRRY